MAVNEQLSAVSYAVRPRLLAHFLGRLALVVAGLTLPPLLVALSFGAYDAALRFLGVVALLTLLGVLGMRLRATDAIQTNEALALTALAFILTPLSMVWPLAASGIPAADALFEAVSGVTTTGLTTLRGMEEMPRWFLFTRAWMQWYGGLGIVILVVALLSGHHLASRRLLDSDNVEDVFGNTRVHARRVVTVYLLLTGAGLVLVVPLVPEPFTGLAHVLSAVSTGGFATSDHSLAALPGVVPYLLELLAFAGALALPLFYLSVAQGPGRLLRDPELHALVLLCLAAATLLALLLARAGLPWDEALHHGVLVGVSAQTGTGFTSLPAGQIPVTAQALLLAVMFIGGSVGSTTGGIKLLRLLVAAKALKMLLARTALPSHALARNRLGGRSLEEPEINRVLLLVALFAATIFLSWLPFLFYGYEPLPALFEVVSAVCTVGLTTGITDQALPTPLKALLCLDMVAGRVEIVALLVLLFPGTWLGKRRGAL